MRHGTRRGGVTCQKDTNFPSWPFRANLCSRVWASPFTIDYSDRLSRQETWRNVAKRHDIFHVDFFAENYNYGNNDHNCDRLNLVAATENVAKTQIFCVGFLAEKYVNEYEDQDVTVYANGSDVIHDVRWRKDVEFFILTCVREYLLRIDHSNWW